MSEEVSDSVFDRFLKRFEVDVMEKVEAELVTGRLHDEGRVRFNLRKDLEGIFLNNLEFHHQMKLVIFCGKQLLAAGESCLAKECFQKICDACTGSQENLDIFRIRIEAQHNVVTCDFIEITHAKNFSLAPMRMSLLLGCLSSVRDTLDDLLALSVKDQEHFAWLVLNGCKLIYTVGYPLLWLDCSKYVYESFIFASLCMDSVINLCTLRHLNFKMKICSAAFSSLVTHGSHEQVRSLVQYARQQVAALREREELDPPLRPETSLQLMRAETDVAVMASVMEFWHNPDSLHLTELLNPFPDAELSHTSQVSAPFAEKCLLECIRTQELTASNSNEPWKKRSSCLIKAFMKYSEQFVALGEGDQEGGSVEHKDEGERGLVASAGMTVESLVSVMSLAMFDELDGVNNEEVLERIMLLRSRSVQSSDSSDISGSDFALLEALTLYISSAAGDISNTSSDSPAAALHLVGSLHDMIHSELFAVRQSLLRKLALGVWSKVVHPALQRVLASVTRAEAPSEELVAIVTPLTSAAVTLVFSGIEDPVLLGSVSIIVAQLLNFVGDTRRCISFLATAVECIDNHRAARVDVQLHCPDDVRDVKALQHSSFTCRSDNAHQWHAAAKRLGAHAFAGFGIFGSASNMSSADQALCDIHLDLLSLLFRVELSCALAGRSKSALLKAATASQDIKTKSKTTKLVGTMETVANLSPTTVAVMPNVDKMSCVSYLRSSWGKSSYAKSVLLVEMARIEKIQAKRLEYLQEAVECVQEAERREMELQAGFADLAVVSASAPRHPVVVARSHAFFYVAPVACRKQGLDRAHHFRVFGREEGSGTDISVTSDELGGCDQLVEVGSLCSPIASAVRISSVRAGEKYSFASAGFTKEGKLVGQISPTCQSIEAANPLPTLSLWANICLLAHEIGEFDLSNRVSSKVCDYYIKLSRPKLENRTFAKGINAFSYDRYSFNMLALQQASTVQLLLFVKCFLAAQEQYVRGLSNNALVDSTAVEIFAVKVHWNFKASEQFKIATNCHRLALVATVASMCGDHSLIVKCVCLGYSLLSQSLLFDMAQMAQVLLNPMLVFLSALKVTPQKNWQALDHQLFCRLLLYAIKCAIINGNTSSLATVLASVHEPTEPQEGQAKSGQSALTLPTSSEYNQLMETVETKASPFATDKFLKQMHELLSLQEYSGDNSAVLDDVTLWNLPDAARSHLVRQSAAALATTNAVEDSAIGVAAKVHAHLKQPPPASSVLLDALTAAAMQLQQEGMSDRLAAFLVAHPVRRDYLHSEVGDECAKWGVEFVCEASSSVDEGDSTARSEHGATEEVAPAPSSHDVAHQFRGIAHLSVILADADFSTDSFRNDFPASDDGPYLQLSEEALQSGSNILLQNKVIKTASGNDDGETTTLVTSETVQKEESQKEDFDDSKVIFLKRISTAVVLFVKGNCYQAAVDASLKMWKFITDQWHNPVSFSSEFSSLKSHLLGLGAALVQMLEAQCAAGSCGDPGGDGHASSQHPRTVKQNLFLLRHPVTFVLKVLCLQLMSKDVVELGLRLLDVYVHNGAEYSNVVCDHSAQYMLFSQEKIISKNSENVSHREKKLNSFIAQWEDMQAKKRKKKMRVVKAEKSDEELRFEADKAALHDKLERAQAALEFSRQKKNLIQQMERRVDGANTSGQQIFDRVRKSSTDFLSDCRSRMRDSPDQFPNFPSVLKSKVELKKFNEIIGHYDQVVMFLREKKDTSNLVSALHEEGDFFLLFGEAARAGGAWRDGVDGFFNVLDAWKHWQAPAEAAVLNVNLKTASSVLTVITILSKLSKHCSANDMDLKSNYCQLAAKLCWIPFKETLNHPVDLHGFAAYSCTDLGGKYSFEFDCDTFSAFSFHNGLDEIINVLGNEKLYLASLPLLVMWEHLHGACTCRPDQWLAVRLRRVQFLVALHLFSEAVSMLAAVAPTLHAIQSGVFTDTLAQARLPHQAGNGAGAGADGGAVIAREVRSNGFEFPNCPPFYNNQTVSSEANQQSLAWISAFPDLFVKLSENFVVILPPLPEEDRPEPAVLEVLEVLDDKKKGGKGGKGGKKVEEPVAVPEIAKQVLNSRPLFSRLHNSEVLVTCSFFLTEVSSLDGRVTVEHHAALGAALEAASTMLEQASALLQVSHPLQGHSSGPTSEGSPSVSWNDSKWVSLYGKCHMLRMRQLCQRREFRVCRAHALDLLKQLNAVSDVFCRAKVELTHVWLSAKLMLAHSAVCQARFGDVLAVAEQGAGEALLISSSFWARRFGYYSALGHFKSGNVVAAQDQCATVRTSYMQCGLCDVDNIRCQLLSAAILHAKLQSECKISAIQTLGGECLEVLRKAVADSERLALVIGFVGNDSNLTFGSATSSLLKHDVFSPFVSGITALHNNHPDMTPSSVSSPHHPAHRVKQNLSADPTHDTLATGNKTLRTGPVDVCDTHSDSEMCNIYLEEVKVLAMCRAALCTLLDELRGTNQTFPGADGSSLSSISLLKEQVLCGEAGLKTLRHVAYPSAFLKASLFLSVGKSRAKETAVRCMGGAFPGCDEFLPPLLAGLQVCMSGPHQWHTMTMYCLEIVECFGNQSLFMEVDPPTRLKMAVKYLMLGAKLDNIQFNVEHNNLHLLDEAGLLDAVCPREIETLLMAITSSSLFSYGKSKGKIKESDLNSSTDASGKGKGAGKGKDGGEQRAGEPSARPCARDAFHQLSALAREQNPFLVDGVEFDFLHDLLRSVRIHFPQVADKLFISQLPNAADELVVTEASITCVWAACVLGGDDSASSPSLSSDPSKTSLFAGLTGYLVLGGLKGEIPSFVSEEPYLRKVLVKKSELAHIAADMVKVLNRLKAAEARHAAGGEDVVDDDRLAQNCCDVLATLLLALRGADKRDDKVREAVSISFLKPSENGGAAHAAVSVSINGTKICKVSMTAAVIQQFVHVVAHDKSCCSLACDKDVSLFFWGALRAF